MANYIIADNQELTHLALEQIISQDSADHKVRTAGSRAQLQQALRQHEHAVVVLDFTLFDYLDENELLTDAERYSMATWVLVSETFGAVLLHRVTHASHAFSVVYKGDSLREIGFALRRAALGERYISQQAMELLLPDRREERPPEVLTHTERDIAIAIALGKTTRDIAAERFSSIHTITTHRKNIFRKLGVGTAHEVVKYALRMGWIDPVEFYI